MKKITIEVPDGKNAIWKENENGESVLTLVSEAPEVNKPVTERIKTFEDACRDIGGTDNALVNQYLFVANGPEMDETGKNLLAYLKLRIIAAALNEGWEPQFTIDEYRYYPWFYLYTKDELDKKSEQWKKEHTLVLWGGVAGDGSACGLASANSTDAFSHSNASLGARLAVKSEELAKYFGKQFIEIWKDYCVIIKEQQA